MATLDRAIEIAALAHTGQCDKTGKPYIVHPMRLMSRFLRKGNEKCAIVAALHDAVEDSDWTLEALTAEGFTDEIVGAVGALTRGQAEDYGLYQSSGKAPAGALGQASRPYRQS
ncbi:MAG TPA: hypothetical protein VGO04_24640 [Ensifer sp.]|uniref:hypothetical protein n=1 Tax=Ensifer sp. TaxID=1872086 RepID=UPI002E150B1A|nr:hypothetical protein [Ensifer sp.]